MLQFPTLQRETVAIKRRATLRRTVGRLAKKMVFGLGKKEEKADAYLSVADSLKRVYKQKLLPLEEHYKCHEFHSPALGSLLGFEKLASEVEPDFG